MKIKTKKKWNSKLQCRSPEQEVARNTVLWWRQSSQARASYMMGGFIDSIMTWSGDLVILALTEVEICNPSITQGGDLLILALSKVEI